jgi:hypothetical protein
VITIIFRLAKNQNAAETKFLQAKTLPRREILKLVSQLKGTLILIFSLREKGTEMFVAFCNAPPAGNSLSRWERVGVRANGTS